MAWYKTGTIAVNGTTVTGTGTNFTDNKAGIGPGQAVLIPGSGTVKMFEIASVDSATKLTLTSSAGTIAAGQAYAIMSFYTDSIPDFARRLSAQLSYYQSQMDGWQQIMTGTGSVTLQAPDGTQVTISSFKKLTDDIAGKLDKSQNLNDVANKATARSNLGLGEAATKGISSGSTLVASGSNPNVLMPEGAGGLCNYNALDGATDGRYNERNGFYAAPGAAGVNYFDQYAPMLVMTRYQNSYGMFQIGPTTGKAAVRGRNGNNFTAWNELYTTGNTTKASDGTLKAASPIIKLYADGSFETNAESEGCTVQRLRVGEYLIEGCEALNADAGWGGWDGGFDIPTDKNKQPLIWLDYEVNADGSVLVKTYHRTYPDSPAFARNEIDGLSDGDPVDIPADQFVSVRAEMPQDSVWNQRQAAIQYEEGDSS